MITQQDVEKGTKVHYAPEFYSEDSFQNGIVKETVVSYEYQKDYYYKEKSNLILYLSAWLTILTSEGIEIKVKDSVNSNKQKSINLERDLLIAVANEEYKKAAKIRDQLSKQLITV